MFDTPTLVRIRLDIKIRNKDVTVDNPFLKIDQPLKHGDLFLLLDTFPEKSPEGVIMQYGTLLDCNGNVNQLGLSTPSWHFEPFRP